MNTFFEKITGASDKYQPLAETVDLSRTKTSRRKSAIEKPQAAVEPATSEKHLRVESDEYEKPQMRSVEEEEEGELTVDIFDRGDEIMIQSTVAGVKPEDLDISITNDNVTIRGKREKMEEINEDNYYYKELFWGTFARSVILPEEIEEDLAEASLKHGLLTIKLPKKRRGVVQKLKVKVS